MATTTNYSWSTPDDTALVKDGAAAIRTLGTAIDSTVFTNAGAAINKTIIDAKGDLIVGSAADTAARLAVGGTDGHVLTVNSGATNGVEWAAVASGGMTLLSTTSLTGASTTISGISGTYTDLQIVLQGITAATANGKIRIAPNGSTNISSQSGGDSNATDFRRVAANYILLEDFKQTNRTNSQNSFTVKISRYATADSVKSYIISGAFEDDSGNRGGTIYGGGITTSSAISSLDISYSGGDFSAGTAYVYGVK
jgi:hypothetical protein